MNKYYNDKGEVGIIVSHGYGAGWSTWGEDHYCFNPVIIEAILNGVKDKELEDIAKKEYPESFTGGLSDKPAVYFLTPGTPFRIDEYDGAESLITSEKLYQIA